MAIIFSPEWGGLVFAEQGDIERGQDMLVGVVGVEDEIAGFGDAVEGAVQDCRRRRVQGDCDSAGVPGGVECGEELGESAGGDALLGLREVGEEGGEDGFAGREWLDEVGEAGDAAGEVGVGGGGVVGIVDPDADDGGGRVEAFDEDAGEFGGADHEVVGPAEAGARDSEAGEHLAQGPACREGEDGPAVGGAGGGEDGGEPEPAGVGDPGAPVAAAAGGLPCGDDGVPAGELTGEVVGGFHEVVVVHVPHGRGGLVGHGTTKAPLVRAGNGDSSDASDAGGLRDVAISTLALGGERCRHCPSNPMKQRTLAREVSVSGHGLHSGQTVTLTLKPAPVDHGIVIKRIDLPGAPEVKPHISLIGDLVRNTGLTTGSVQIHLVEHVLSALHGCGIDNVVVEMDAGEPPIMDGSAKPFVNLILQGEPVEQSKDRAAFCLDVPVSVTRGNSSLIALPCDELKITCTSADDRGIHTQHLSLTINPDVYITQVAAARTFTVYEDIEPLLKMGKIKGGSLDCAVVIKGDKILSKEGLRFPDEFVRHKILDLIGDILLLGVPLKAHIIAVRPGHAINAELTKAIAARFEEKSKEPKKKARPARVLATETSLDIRRILDTIPHRYPFVMIDRIVEFISDNELVAIKNVTINEPFFQGHFPGNPVMPGVLQLEAMAQAAGVLMLRRTSKANCTAFFMSADKVKFRRPVRPGDQVIINAKITKVRGEKLAAAECSCTVDGQVVSSAELMFTIVDEGADA